MGGIAAIAGLARRLRGYDFDWTAERHSRCGCVGGLSDVATRKRPTGKKTRPFYEEFIGGVHPILVVELSGCYRPPRYSLRRSVHEQSFHCTAVSRFLPAASAGCIGRASDAIRRCRLCHRSEFPRHVGAIAGSRRLGRVRRESPHRAESMDVLDASPDSPTEPGGLSDLRNGSHTRCHLDRRNANADH